MKLKLILLLISLNCMVSLNAQDLNFLGVSLELPADEIHDALLQKGLADRESNYNDGYYMTGNFWKFSDCNISVHGYPYTAVSVTAPAWTTVSTMADLISSLNSKYGVADDSQSNDFKKEWRWKVGDNYIVITDFYIDSHNYNITYMSKMASARLENNTKNFNEDL